MADSLYFSLWFSDFSTESMFVRALAVMREFPFSQSRPGITALALHPVAWTEPTIVEEQFAPGALPEEAAAIASEGEHVGLGLGGGWGDAGHTAGKPAATIPIRGAPYDSCGQRHVALRHQKARHVSSRETKAAS